MPCLHFEHEHEHENHVLEMEEQKAKESEVVGHGISPNFQFLDYLLHKKINPYF